MPNGSIARALRKVGSDLRDGRRRRRITIRVLAERTSLGISTIKNIEKGSPTVALGNYAMVLFALGLIDRLYELADVRYDPAGLALDEERLPQRVRMPGKRKGAK